MYTSHRRCGLALLFSSELKLIRHQPHVSLHVKL